MLSPGKSLLVGIYGRVSVDKRDGRSVDSQVGLGKRWVEREGHRLYRVWRDDDISASKYAKSKTRDDWQQAMDAINRRAIQMLWVWELSRTTRDRMVWAALIGACQDSEVLLCIDETVRDPNDPDDAFALDQSASLGVRESAMISKRVLRVVRERAAAGEPHGPTPFGYRRVYDSNTGQLTRQVPDPETAPILREIAGRILAAEPLASIARGLNSRGTLTPIEVRYRRYGRPCPDHPGWTQQLVRRTIIRPVYAGLRSHDGRTVPATWEPILSLDVHQTLLAKLGDPDRLTWQDGGVRHLLVNIAVCGVCGATMRRLGRVHERRPSVYQCRDKFCVSIKQEWLDEAVTVWLLNWLAEPGIRERLVARSTDVGDDIAQAVAELRELEAQLAAARASYTTGPVKDRISIGTLVALEQALTPQIDAARERATPAMQSTVVRDLISHDPAATWAELGIPQRREAVRGLISVTLHKGRPGNPAFDPDRIEIRPLTQREGSS
jgi:DNA invertase Pin-like site-specific DNA recombinase